ncbi:hypothetical protein E1298_35665 [Actinomadura rubrisoli]|uniref:Uncharacterized protein n=2 Tax=Actinomadura rubrisoli TaxID=2530368 RepID=A0A4R5AIJ9_9ACTN|nr:hypothetical protein [Actinomadura rubrisoli]TDD71525.1 hypothetical protein E1298_35665 [Actinomadura rubrisoli]
MGMEEVVRQLRMAIHDAQVAFDCIGLGEVERAHNRMITAKAAMDAAETVLQHDLGRFPLAELAGEGAKVMAAIGD